MDTVTIAGPSTSDGRYLWDDGGRHLVRGFVGCARGKIWEWWEVLDRTDLAGALPRLVLTCPTRSAAVERARALNLPPPARPSGRR